MYSFENPSHSVYISSIRRLYRLYIETHLAHDLVVCLQSHFKQIILNRRIDWIFVVAVALPQGWAGIQDRPVPTFGGRSGKNRCPGSPVPLF